MDTVCELAENITYDHFGKGDSLVDNFLVAHGCRPLLVPRKVLASLAS